MIGSVFFIFNRLVEIVFLIPIIGMMVSSSNRMTDRPREIRLTQQQKQAYFVDGYVKANQITPIYILILFIISVIAIFWSVDTLIRHATTKRSAIFVAFVDLLFFGAFIAAVYQLRFIANADCGNWHGDSDIYISLGPFGAYGAHTGNPLAKDLNKTCAMLKACFAIGIMETLFFLWTAILAVFLHFGQHGVGGRKESSSSSRRRRSHSSRRGHGHGSRHRSSSRRPHYVV